jgi:LPS O-antigen subunit length determinant protein (WzzB/FepE family)
MESTPVLDQVLQQAQALGLPVERLTYGENAFLERRRSVLEMQVRDPDPKVATNLTNLWADTAYAVLSESYKHALKAQSLRSEINGLMTCLQTPEGASPPGILCEAGTPEEIQSRIQIAQASLDNETLASNAILPAMLFDLSKRADIPQTPVAYRANLFILGGALIGFVLGVVLASLRFRTA